MAKRPLRKAASDLQQQLNSDLNALVALTLEELATDENDGGASPVDTGFLRQVGRQALLVIAPGMSVSGFLLGTKLKQSR